MRTGVRIGIDPGDARIGVAASDPSGVIAVPIETVRRGKGDLARLKNLVDEQEAMEVVIGLPRSLNGAEGPAADKTRKFARTLARRIQPVPVRLWDERLTTVTAENALRDSGKKGQARRKVVDQAAAMIILQSALDRERSSGDPAGELVGDGKAGDV